MGPVIRNSPVLGKLCRVNPQTLIMVRIKNDYNLFCVGNCEDECEDNKILSITKKIELLFHTKTSFCKHKSPDCITNAVHGLISNFKIGLKIRVAFTLLQVLLRGGKLNKIKIVD